MLLGLVFRHGCKGRRLKRPARKLEAPPFLSAGFRV